MYNSETHINKWGSIKLSAVIYEKHKYAVK